RHSRRPRPARPGAEVLEDRTTPATFDISPVPSPLAVPEGNTGSTLAFFRVTLSAPAAGGQEVIYAPSGGTATAEDCVAVPPTTLTCAPGETTKVIAVAVNGDTVFEPNENFLVNLGSAANAVISVAQGTGTATIVYDDPFPVPPAPAAQPTPGITV